MFPPIICLLFLHGYYIKFRGGGTRVKKKKKNGNNNVLYSIDKRLSRLSTNIYDSDLGEKLIHLPRYAQSLYNIVYEIGICWNLGCNAPV